MHRIIAAQLIKYVFNFAWKMPNIVHVYCIEILNSKLVNRYSITCTLGGQVTKPIILEKICYKLLHVIQGVKIFLIK